MTFQAIVLVILQVWMEVCSSPRSEFVLYLDIQGRAEKTVDFGVIQIQV